MATADIEDRRDYQGNRQPIDDTPLVGRKKPHE